MGGCSNHKFAYFVFEREISDPKVYQPSEEPAAVQHGILTSFCVFAGGGLRGGLVTPRVALF